MTDKPDDAKDDLIWALADKVGLHNAKELVNIIVAAGWSPPVESRLRVVFNSNDKPPYGLEGSWDVPRPLTLEELVEVAERPFFTNTSLMLSSGARVILVEEK